MSLDREAALNALKALVVAYGGGTPYFRTVSRRLKTWDEVGPEAQPACLIHDASEFTERQGENSPSKESLRPEIFLYSRADNPSDIPSSIMNASIAAFLAAIAPTGRDLVMFGRQTLGGLVSHCYVDGETAKFPGDQDNQNVVILPLRILGP